ncbi:MAG: hypothetical protein ACXVAX_07475 [Pseudobdellovibrio sp.]
MKSVLLGLVLLASTQLFAGQVEIGKYRAVDKDTKTIVATFELRANGTVNFSVKTPDFTMPAPGCEGKYTVNGNTFQSDLKCPTELLPEANVTIDVSNVTPAGLRSANGVEVPVVIDALGSDPTVFLLKKND